MNNYQLAVKVGLFLLLTSFAAPKLTAQSVDDLDDEFDALDAQLDSQFEKQDQVLEKRFLQVKKAVERAYSGLSKKISVNWNDDVVLPNTQSWTTYDDTFNSRATFDFASGVYKVETIVGQDVAESLVKLQAFAAKIANSSQAELKQADVFEQALQHELQQHKVTQVALFQPLQKAEPYIDVKRILASNTSQVIETLALDSATKQAVEEPMLLHAKPQNKNRSKALKETTVVSDVSTQSKGHESKTQELTANKSFKEAEVAEPQIEAINALASVGPKIKLESKQAVKRLVLTIPFINNYQKNLLQDKLDTVRELAKKYQLDVSLILAVIETESSFNPMATSPVPAFGLMQLVPNTAGLDAYEFLYGQKQIVSPDYLFDQNNNLLLGTTYLHILSKRYLRGISNQQSKLYCMLASYNTGVGNVAKTFTGQKSLNLAIAKINTLEAEQTYAQLMDNLPADETKNYLRKVLARKQQYSHFD